MGTILLHVVAIALAAIALWWMRYELSERARTRLGWAVPPILAVASAALLLVVSPGKRPELWVICAVVGFVAGLAAGVIMGGERDFAQKLVRAYRTWDGIGAAGLLLVLAVARFVSTDLLHRPSSGFGVLAGAAVLVAFFLVGRVLTFHLYASHRFVHYDMEPGQKRYRMSD